MLAEGSYDREPAGAWTSLTFRLRAAPRGLARLMTPLVAKTMASEVSHLGRLREVLEA
ncbi:MAG: hypothetical protein M3071_19070 [Actinomycetota bacterium]|nr:hypothetical protein [Actinomycetota bacterium]